MSKLLLALLVLVPLAMAARTQGSLGLTVEDAEFADAFIQVYDNNPVVAATAAANATVVGNATVAANATAADRPPLVATPTAEPEPPKRKFRPLTRPTPKVQPKPKAKKPHRVRKAGPKPKPAPRIPRTRAYALVNFGINLPNGDWSKAPKKFEKQLLLELSKGLELPRRRFTIQKINPGIDVVLRINQLHRLDNQNAPHALDIASKFRDRAMDPANVWRNLPILARIDRTKSIVWDIKEQLPPPKEKPQAAQMRLSADVRMVEPLIPEYIKAFELDVATAIGIEPEQIAVTDIRADEDGTSLTALIVSFKFYARLRDLPEREVTPTEAVNRLFRQLTLEGSPLRSAPITKNLDPKFPVQDLWPKKPDQVPWLHNPAKYTNAVILPDAPTYERPLVLPTLMVVPPASPAEEQAAAKAAAPLVAAIINQA